MANTYFDFKQFRIEQSNCANKVSTDACVFGAWMAKLIPSGKVLDIGAGSGLLSLILAQGNAQKVIGIELDPNCAQQAAENVSLSKFSDKVDILTADARNWQGTANFDYIISNPPFFNNTFKNTDSRKTQARQTESLGPKDWVQILANNSKENTLVALLLSNNDVLEAYEDQFTDLGYIIQKIELLDHSKATCKRVILFAGKRKMEKDLPATFTYKNQDGSYTDEMIALLKDYYLHL